MGLGIDLGPLNAGYLKKVTAALAAAKLKPWNEPKELGDLGMREHMTSFSYSTLHYLRRVYALHLRKKPITPVGDEGLAAYENMLLDEASAMRSHLVCHSDTEGVYIPVDFKEPLFLEPSYEAVGSSQALMRELIVCAEPIGIVLKDGVLSDAEATRIYEAIGDDGPWQNEHIAWLALFEAARVSIANSTVIHFV